METGSSQAGGVEVIVRIISSMGRWYYGGASINDATHLEGGDLPKGEVTSLAYLVKWVTRGREG